MDIENVQPNPVLLASISVFAELVDILFVDTTPFVNAYFTKTEGHTYDWRGIHPRKEYIANLLKVFFFNAVY